MKPGVIDQTCVLSKWSQCGTKEYYKVQQHSCCMPDQKDGPNIGKWRSPLLQYLDTEVSEDKVSK